MKDNKVFIDTNILVYLVKDNTEKSEKIATQIPDKQGSIISMQVVNEFCNVASKKLKFSYDNISFCINRFVDNFTVADVKISTIREALKIKEKYKYSYYDSVIIASALQNNCSILYTEDMQHNQLIENKLTIINPFK